MENRLGRSTSSRRNKRQKRKAADFSRFLTDYQRTENNGKRTAFSQGPRGRIQPAEVRFPCQYEPRNTHSAKCYHRFLKHPCYCRRGTGKQEYINIIESNNTLLLQLISDILDLSKIEAGTLDFSYSNVELNDILSEIESVVRYRTETSGVQLIAHKGLPSCPIKTEKNRLMQVLNNLLNNASKFTSQGSITFGYELCGRELYFYIKDTGCGIPADKVNSIFGRFVKLNSFVQGTGLGLSICQTIVEHMGGRIGVESEEGKGSTFWFTIPYQPADADNKKEDKHQPISVQKDKLTILVAEDNESNYRLFQSILKREYNLVHAWDGKEAVNLYKLHNPQIILMDINMPVMDGYEATREIRKLSLDVPIIAVTAFAYASDEQRVMENGFDGYMAKPISAPQLRQQIAAILQKRIILL